MGSASHLSGVCRMKVSHTSVPPPDPEPRRRCSHPRREGHRGAEAFPRPLGGLLQATAGESGETVWCKVPGKRFLPVSDLFSCMKKGSVAQCGHFQQAVIESAAFSFMSSVVFDLKEINMYVSVLLQKSIM